MCHRLIGRAAVVGVVQDVVPLFIDENPGRRTDESDVTDVLPGRQRHRQEVAVVFRNHAGRRDEDRGDSRLRVAVEDAAGRGRRERLCVRSRGNRRRDRREAENDVCRPGHRHAHQRRQAGAENVGDDLDLVGVSRTAGEVGNLLAGVVDLAERVAEDVVAIAAGESIGGGVAVQRVVAVLAVEDVVAIVAPDIVVVGTTVEGVVAPVAEKGVVAGAAAQGIVTGIPVEIVVVGIAVEDVVVVAAVGSIDIHASH